MKRVICILFALAVLCALSVPVLAAEHAVLDGADLLTESEQQRLERTLEQISEEHGIDLVVLTADSLEGQTPQRYATNYYDDRYGDDGILLLVSMEDRDWYFTMVGKCKTRIPDSSFDDSEFLELLSSGEYYEAFTEFADTCDRKLSNFKFKVTLWGLGLGILAGMIVVLIMKGRMKSVRPQAGADQYAGSQDLQLTHRSDIFLYQTVTRRPKPQQSSDGSSMGGSGRSYGGGGGKF